MQEPQRPSVAKILCEGAEIAVETASVQWQTLRMNQDIKLERSEVTRAAPHQLGNKRFYSWFWGRREIIIWKEQFVDNFLTSILGNRKRFMDSRGLARAGLGI